MRTERLVGVLQAIAFDGNGAGCAEISGSKGVDYISFEQAVLVRKDRLKLFEDISRIKARRLFHLVAIPDQVVVNGLLVDLRAA